MHSPTSNHSHQQPQKDTKQLQRHKERPHTFKTNYKETQNNHSDSKQPEINRHDNKETKCDHKNMYNNWKRHKKIKATQKFDYIENKTTANKMRNNYKETPNNYKESQNNTKRRRTTIHSKQLQRDTRWPQKHVKQPNC